MSKVNKRKIRELAMQILFLWDTQNRDDAEMARQVLADATDDPELREKALEMAKALNECSGLERRKVGAETASDSGRWLGLATSNFCGPQFDGMWRDVRWHREMTAIIRSGTIAADLRSGRLWDRL